MTVSVDRREMLIFSTQGSDRSECVDVYPKKDKAV